MPGQMSLQRLTPAKMDLRSYLLLFLVASTQAAPQMEMMDQPIADAYKTVNNVMGNALDVVFELSSWFTDYETAPYTNIGEIGPDGIEERLYPARKWVCTKKVTSMTGSDPKSRMFWSVFKYIQGGNSAEEKIEITTPVTTLAKANIAAGSVTYEMCFFIGAAYESNAPTPSNTRVYIKEEPERRIFTRKVGGWMDAEKWEREATELKELLTRKGLSFSDESYYLAGYDAPSKVLNRRNEVWFYSLN